MTKKELDRRYIKFLKKCRTLAIKTGQPEQAAEFTKKILKNKDDLKKKEFYKKSLCLTCAKENYNDRPTVNYIIAIVCDAYRSNK
jgi:hypothetical protein